MLLLMWLPWSASAQLAPKRPRTPPPPPPVSEPVQRGLDFLKTKQLPSGAWGTIFPCAMTGLAMKTLLNSALPDEAVAKAAATLIAVGMADPKGIIAVRGDAEPPFIYENAIALEALARFYIAGGNAPDLEAVLTKTTNHILKCQTKAGGWSYGEVPGYKLETRGDLSATWWHYHALKSVETAGINLPGIAPALKRVDKFFADHVQKDGGIGLPKLNRGDAYAAFTITGPALSVLGLTRPTDRVTLQATKFVLGEITIEPPDWDKNANLYHWYATTLGLKSANPQAYKTWSALVTPQLIKHQGADGAWPTETIKYPLASTEVARDDASIYRLCLCLLTLESLGK